MADQLPTRIRQLEFTHSCQGLTADAFGITGFYQIVGNQWSWTVICRRGLALHYEEYLPTQAAARRWAQADFEARIMAELVGASS
jgi:hypothetical protein